jgi:hypothetical protein
MQLFCVWNEPSFEEMLLCGSVPKTVADGCKLMTTLCVEDHF